jgi:nucleoid-associated protein YgaU
LNKPFIIISLFGVVAIAVAIGLNFMLQEPDGTPAPAVQSTKPEATAQSAEKAIIDPPTFDIVRVAPNGDTVIAGRAMPTSTVINIDNDVEFGQVKADDRGEWVFVPEQPLKPGTHTLRLKMLFGSHDPVMSVEDVVVIVPKAGEDIAGRTGDSRVLAMKMNPNGTTTVLQKPGGTGKIKLSVDAVNYDDRGSLSISGSAEPEATIQIYLDNDFIGHATTGPDEGQGSGKWSMNPDDPVKPGLYTLRADQVDNTRKVIQRVEFPFSRAEPTSEKMKEGTIVVQPGNSLWRISRSSYGQGINFTIIYEANKDQIGNPDLIYPGQIFKVPKN